MSGSYAIVAITQCGRETCSHTGDASGPPLGTGRLLPRYLPGLPAELPTLFNLVFAGACVEQAPTSAIAK